MIVHWPTLVFCTPILTDRVCESSHASRRHNTHKDLDADTTRDGSPRRLILKKHAVRCELSSYDMSSISNGCERLTYTMACPCARIAAYAVLAADTMLAPNAHVDVMSIYSPMYNICALSPRPKYRRKPLTFCSLDIWSL